MDEIKDITKLKQSLRVAELYFQDNLSQIEIAARLGVSRPTVSRLLQYAKDNGLVKIQIVNPLVDSQVLSKQLSDKYGIEFHVVPNNYGGTVSIQDGVGRYTADFLSANVQAGDIIGIGWGKPSIRSPSNSKSRMLPAFRWFNSKVVSVIPRKKLGPMSQSMNWRKPIIPIPSICRCR